MELNKKVMTKEQPWWWMLVLATMTANSVSGSMCERGRTWWDKRQNLCLPCTKCDPELRLTVKLPCELHRDAICHSLNEINIWPEQDSLDNDNVISNEYDYVDYDDVDSDVDLQTSSVLTLAASGCVVFFVVVLCMSVYHAKQWRILKQALKSDVQDLSAKLKLMESGGDPRSDPVMSADHHLYCNIHVAKERNGPTSNSKGLGNDYTQEKHPS